MNDMVTRVAKALAGHVHKNGDYGMTGEDAYEERPSDFDSMARAAIEAMRIPTKAMLDAVSEEEERRGYVASAYESMDAEAAWPVMIDAALKEEKA
ncbi:MAG: hypothetical protein AAAB13_20475 [Pseudomonas sp.]